jgi:hypothetical protein
VVPVIIAHMQRASDRANRKVGRPSKGSRVQVNLRIPTALRKKLAGYLKYKRLAGKGTTEWNALYIICIKHWWKHVGRRVTARREERLQR